MRILIANQNRTIIDEIRPDVESVSWILNDVGKMKFSMSKGDNKATEQNLKIGNFVVVEFDNGLPMWAGIVDTPRMFSAQSIGINAYSIEHMLKFRMTDKGRYFSSVPVGTIFQSIISESEALYPLGISIGSVWLGGGSHSPEYHFKDIWSILTDSIRKIEVCDFRFIPSVANGQLNFTAELYERAGIDKTNSVTLRSHANVLDGVVVHEQGKIINEFVAVGAGSTWGSERTAIRASESNSKTLYGVRQDSEIYASVTTQETLEAHATVQIAANAYPRYRFTLSVTNDKPGTFADYDLGDIVNLELPDIGFGYSGDVRIVGREYKPNDGICDLLVEEYNQSSITVTLENI